MKLTALVKLQPDDAQRQHLLTTLENANAACDYVSKRAWQARTFNQFRLHHLSYRAVRSRFNFSAQMAVRCIGKVADAYKKDKRTKRQFNRHGAVTYDSRILKWCLADQTVSLWTLGGRQRVPFVCGEYQRRLLQYQHGESDLIYRNRHFYLAATCDIPDEAPLEFEGILGVDLGVKNIATDSDGHFYSAKHLMNIRHRHRRLRKKLQSKRTRSARRRLKKLSGQEQRFARNTNHVISKQLVQLAKDTRRAIALENLTGIRTRITVRRQKRDELHSWSFAQLRQFVAYKAQRLGVQMALVDPRDSSRECSECGYTDKANRPTQAIFACKSCGHASHADVNAARVISRRAAINLPHVSTTGYSPSPSSEVFVTSGTSFRL